MRKCLDLAIQIADGMAAAHNAGFVHRDLKPENILVNREGRVKILDFGLAKRADSVGGDDKLTETMRLTDPGTTVGTVAYMSPEQARGDQSLGPQSDQFSFGLVLYEMATGHSAFRRNSRAETMTAIIREDAEPLPATVPQPLRWLIERLLAKDPADRYDSSRDLHRELRHIRERPSEATMSAQAVSVAASPNRHRFWTVALAAGALVLGAALAWLLIPHKGAQFVRLSLHPIVRRCCHRMDACMVAGWQEHRLLCHGSRSLAVEDESGWVRAAYAAYAWITRRLLPVLVTGRIANILHRCNPRALGSRCRRWKPRVCARRSVGARRNSS